MLNPETCFLQLQICVKNIIPQPSFITHSSSRADLLPAQRSLLNTDSNDLLIQSHTQVPYYFTAQTKCGGNLLN